MWNRNPNVNAWEPASHKKVHVANECGNRKLSRAQTAMDTLCGSVAASAADASRVEWSGVIANTNWVNAENGTNIVPRMGKRNYYYARQCRGLFAFTCVRLRVVVFVVARLAASPAIVGCQVIVYVFIV